MSRSKGKLPPRRLPEDELGYRSAALRATEAEEEQRSIPAILATEDPVEVFDRRSGKVIRESLVLSGGEWPAQLPLVDTHNHETVRAVLGSFRGLKRGERELEARAHFSGKTEAQDAFRLAQEGHLTDVSLGFRRLKTRNLAAGERAVVNGHEFVGPLRLVEKWRALEGSVTSIGKDSRSKFLPGLRAYLFPHDCEKEYQMETAIRNALVARGMPEDASDEAAERWIDEQLGTRSADGADADSGAKDQPKEKAKGATKPAAKADDDEISQRSVGKDVADLIQEGLADYHEREAQRSAFVRKLVNRSAIPYDKREEAINQLISGRSAGAELATELLDLQEKYRKPIGSAGIEFTGSGDEGYRAAIFQGFCTRNFGGLDKDEKPIPGANEFAGRTLLELSALCLEKWGGAEGVRSWDRKRLIRQAFAMRDDEIGLRASDGPAFMHTGTMTTLLMDVGNKRLAQSYEAAEAETTYQRWARQEEDAPDFKDIHVVNMSELGYQPQVPEGDDYKDLKFSDKREKYKVFKHGSILSLTLEAIINDDLRAFNRFQSHQAASMRRTINKSIYDELFANPVLLEDGKAVFHADHSNLFSADLSVASLDDAYVSMMLQTGMNSAVTLNLMPSFLLIGPALSATASLLLNSIADPTVSLDVLQNTETPKYNSGTVNKYGPSGDRRLTKITEALIHGNDPNSWYLISASAVVDHMIYCFLRGERTPVMEQETGFVNDTVKWKIRQTWGQRLVDFRGISKSTGVA